MIDAPNVQPCAGQYRLDGRLFAVCRNCARLLAYQMGSERVPVTPSFYGPTHPAGRAWCDSKVRLIAAEV